MPRHQHQHRPQAQQRHRRPTFVDVARRRAAYLARRDAYLARRESHHAYIRLYAACSHINSPENVLHHIMSEIKDVCEMREGNFFHMDELVKYESGIRSVGHTGELIKFFPPLFAQVYIR
jgi:hypothetical protein